MPVTEIKRHSSNGQIAFRSVGGGNPFPIQGKDVREEELKNFFKKHDRNGDGVLDKKELKAAFKRLGAILPGRRASRGLADADGDNDGFINERELTRLVNYAIKYGFKVK